jgi:hypothetical protein
MLNPEFTQNRKQMPTLLKQICPVLNTFSLSFHILSLIPERDTSTFGTKLFVGICILSDYF